jgi:hypothetical protein
VAGWEIAVVDEALVLRPHQEWDASERCPIGRDPRTMTVAELEALGFQRRAPVKIIRAKCLDCCCGNVAEVRRCGQIDCPSWPYRPRDRSVAGATFRDCGGGGPKPGPCPRPVKLRARANRATPSRRVGVAAPCRDVWQALAYTGSAAARRARLGRGCRATRLSGGA